MTFTSVSGHLKELRFAASHKDWNNVPPQSLFTAPVHKYVKDTNMPIKENLENEAKKCSILILWLDCDREGENIAFEVRNNSTYKYILSIFDALDV